MKILTGSSAFFSCYEDFQPGDIDEIEIVDEGDFNHLHQLSGQGHCLFQLKRKNNKQEYIEWDLLHSPGMVIARYLTKEFADAIGLTIEDLTHLSPLVDKLGKKHIYLKVIYDNYLNNKGFFLTDEQREEAYMKYRESRGE